MMNLAARPGIIASRGPLPGLRWVFANGYGASVITGPHAYASEDAPYELAVLYRDKLCYDSGLADGVIGHQTEAEILALLDKVEALPPR